MALNDVTRPVLEHFRRTLTMFREAVQTFPVEEWRAGELNYLRPAGIAYHVLETIDFYTGEESIDAFEWGGRFGVDWEGAHSDQLPSQEQVLLYLDEVQARVEEWLTGNDLLAPEQTYPWTGSVLLARALYILRNTQHHVAELSLELTRRGYPAPEWK